LGLADQKRFLLEVLDKNQLYVKLSEIDDINHRVSEQDKVSTGSFTVHKSDWKSDLRNARSLK